MQSLTRTSRECPEGISLCRAESASVYGCSSSSLSFGVLEVLCAYYDPEEGKTVAPVVIYIHGETESQSTAETRMSVPCSYSIAE